MSTAGAAHAAQINALKAMGALVQVDENTFHKLLSREESPMVLMAPPAGMFRKYYRYAFAHRGYVFFMDSRNPVMFGRMLDLVEVKYILMPLMG